MKTLIAFVKVIFFGILTVIVGKILYTHGSQSIATTAANHDPDWPNLLKDLGGLVLLILCITGVRRSWVNRHQGSDSDSRRDRRRHRKIDDVIRIPK